MLVRVDMRRLYTESFHHSIFLQACRMFIDDNTVFAPFKTCFGYTPNANMADLSDGPGLVARKRG